MHISRLFLNNKKEVKKSMCFISDCQFSGQYARRLIASWILQQENLKCWICSLLFAPNISCAPFLFSTFFCIYCFVDDSYSFTLVRLHQPQKQTYQCTLCSSGRDASGKLC